MINGLTVGYLYVLNWVQADPEDYDLTGKTEGTHFIKLQMNLEARGAINNIGKTTPYFGGKGRRAKKDGQNVILRISGIATSWTAFGLIQKYVSLASKYAQGSEYLLWKRATNDYFPFVDDSSTVKKVATGSTLGIGSFSYEAGKSNVNLQYMFEVIWS